jgi:hypothetical protein
MATPRKRYNIARRYRNPRTPSSQRFSQALLLGKEQGDSLGVFTIIGSAAFNLFIITSICIISVPSPDVKFIKEFGVFLTTTFYSVKSSTSDNSKDTKGISLFFA